MNIHYFAKQFRLYTAAFPRWLLSIKPVSRLSWPLLVFLLQSIKAKGKHLFSHFGVQQQTIWDKRRIKREEYNKKGRRERRERTSYSPWLGFIDHVGICVGRAWAKRQRKKGKENWRVRESNLQEDQNIRSTEVSLYSIDIICCSIIPLIVQAQNMQPPSMPRMLRSRTPPHLIN